MTTTELERRHYINRVIGNYLAKNLPAVPTAEVSEVRKDTDEMLDAIGRPSPWDLEMGE